MIKEMNKERNPYITMLSATPLRLKNTAKNTLNEESIMITNKTEISDNPRSDSQ